MAVRRLLAAALKKHWFAVVAGTLLMLVLVAVGLVPPLVIRSIVDHAIPARDLGALGRQVLALVGLYVATSGMNLGTSILFVVTSQRILHEIRRSVFRHVVSLPIEILERNQTGYLTSRMNEITGLGPLFGSGAFRMVVSVFEFVGVLVMLLALNIPLSLVVLAFLPAYYLATRYVSGGYRKTAKALYQTGGLMAGKLQETFQGISEVKNLGLEERRAREAIRLSSEVAKVGIKQGQVANIGAEAMVLIASLATTALLYFSGRFIVSGTFTLGGYLAFAAYAAKILGPVGYVTTYTMSLQPALGAVERLDEFLSETTEVVRYEGKPAPGALESVEFRTVSFTYPARPDATALDGLDINLRCPGAVTIVGPNGAGKSTLVKLLLGYYSTYDGEILINGRELRSLDVLAWRRQVAIVSQEPFLFDGTVRENLEIAGDLAAALADLGPELGVSNLIARLPEGLDTLVGEGGRRLSGGQRQIVAIIRALLRKADLVIFDEATSHLDGEAKDVLRQALRVLFRDKLCLVITHDPALADLGGTVVNLEAGKITFHRSSHGRSAES